MAKKGVSPKKPRTTIEPEEFCKAYASAVKNGLSKSELAAKLGTSPQAISIKRMTLEKLGLKFEKLTTKRAPKYTPDRIKALKAILAG